VSKAPTSKEIDDQSIIIELAKPDDAEIICDIRDRAWLEAYPNTTLGITTEDVRAMAQGYEGEFVPRRIAYLKEQLTKDDPNQVIYVAKIDNKVVGFIDPRIDEQKHLYIGAIYVAPEAQGKGVGGKLMKQVLDWSGRDHDIYLAVVSYNQNAIDFYKRFGFEKTGAAVPEEEDRPDYLKTLPQIEMVLKATPKEQNNQTLVVEPAKSEDAEAVSELLRRTWMATYPNVEASISEDDIRLRTDGENGERIPQNIKKWRERIEKSDGLGAVFVARIHNEVIGVAAPGFINGRRDVGALYVLPDAQRQGVGSKLMKKILEWHGDQEDIYLRVANYNQNAINFYKAFGFVQNDKPVIDEVNVYGNTHIPEIEMIKSKVQ
jgi:ribosomal protein S18 acetylase RimI-like enzyme